VEIETNVSPVVCVTVDSSDVETELLDVDVVVDDDEVIEMTVFCPVVVVGIV